MRTAALIVAAGRGHRLGGDTPKQYCAVAGRAVLRHAIEAMLAEPAIGLVLAVIHPVDGPLYDAAITGAPGDRLLPPVAGGATRGASVLNGLEALAPHAPDVVLIHDAARPFVPGPVIGAVLDALATAPAAFPALPIIDALWRGAEGVVEAPVARAGLYRAQTPQGFRFLDILAAHRAFSGEAADDVEVARAAGLEVRLVPGDEEAFKITTPADLARARERREGRVDIRTGNGFDVHRFGPGDHVMLCGVAVPHEHGLVGHSDADVGLHALTDAIFGALAEGDIGQWFPPSDPQWKGAASHIFVKHAARIVRAAGGRIANADVTLICEVPKIGPHREAMVAAMADMLAVAPERISVKATTNEKLGFLGREEGIAAFATVSVVYQGEVPQ